MSYAGKGVGVVMHPSQAEHRAGLLYEDNSEVYEQDYKASKITFVQSQNVVQCLCMYTVFQERWKLSGENPPTEKDRLTGKFSLKGACGGHLVQIYAPNKVNFKTLFKVLPRLLLKISNSTVSLEYEKDLRNEILSLKDSSSGHSFGFVGLGLNIRRSWLFSEGRATFPEFSSLNGKIHRREFFHSVSTPQGQLICSSSQSMSLKSSEAVWS